jgi:hypothetical protein
MPDDQLRGILGLIFGVLAFIPMVQIIGKAGYSRWWGVLMLIPLVNLIMLWVFAMSRWPALRDKKT